MTAHKTAAASAAGAVTVILVWAAGLFGLDVPPEVSSAFTTLIAAAAVWRVPNRRKRVTRKKR